MMFQNDSLAQGLLVIYLCAIGFFLVLIGLHLIERFLSGEKDDDENE